MTFPRSFGQIPIYYNHYNTGRPAPGDNETNYRSGYIDMVKSPKYAFGYSLSYTTFEYSNLKLSKNSINAKESITASFILTNTGKYAGEEVAQLYIQDVIAQPVRPLKELTDFQKVMLKSRESKTLTFKIDESKLSFYNDKLEWIIQRGEFKLMVGGSSDDIKLEDKLLVIE